jgi:hypothetical protein
MRAFINSAIRLVLIAASALIVPQSVLHAQERETRAVANIPFAFQIGAYHYAAGKYTLLLNQEHILAIHGTEDSGLMQVSWDSANRPSSISELVFHHYGNHYFLRELRFKGNQEFLNSGKSKDERLAQNEEAIAKNHKVNPDQQSTLEVALVAPSR